MAAKPAGIEITSLSPYVGLYTIHKYETKQTKYIALKSDKKQYRCNG